VIRNALAVHEFLLKERRRGGQLLIRTRDGKEREVAIVPMQ
jgi:hypothetical protein